MTPLISLLINGPCPQLPYFDFRATPNSFQWADLAVPVTGLDFTHAQPMELIKLVNCKRAGEQWKCDMDALQACTALVLILPCGNSSHFEFGWARAKGKRTAVFMPDVVKSYKLDLVYREADLITYNYEVLGEWLHKVLNMPLSSTAVGSGVEESTDDRS